MGVHTSEQDTVFTQDSLELVLTELQTKLDKNPSAGLIIAVDFNAPGIDWENITVDSKGPTGECAKDYNVMNMLGTYELTQFVQKPTRHKAILVLFCSNKLGLVKQSP